MTREAVLEARLRQVEEEIRRLEGEAARPVHPALEGAPLGRIGSGSGRRAARTLQRLNRLREAALERTVHLATRLTALYRERDHLRAALAAERARLQREAAEAERVASIEAALREAGPGVWVVDDAYGACKVVRVNRRTVTIETPSGYREAREFRRIERVLGRLPDPGAGDGARAARGEADPPIPAHG